MFKVISYLIFLLRATNKRNMGSSIAQTNIAYCFDKNKGIQLSKQHSNYRKSLSVNEDSIEVTDFGAGSKVFKSTLRPIHKIARYAGLKKKRTSALINLVKHLKPKTILEFGTSLGLSTYAMYLGSPKSKIITLEGCPNTLGVAEKQFKKFSLNTAETMLGAFDTSLDKMHTKAPFDFVYFDGNHQKEATLNYFKFCLEHSSPNALFIFDDIHWSREMESAWTHIKEHPKVATTIDTYQWGIVMLTAEKEIEKEHFIIRV